MFHPRGTRVKQGETRNFKLFNYFLQLIPPTHFLCLPQKMLAFLFPLFLTFFRCRFSYFSVFRFTFSFWDTLFKYFPYNFSFLSREKFIPFLVFPFLSSTILIFINLLNFIFINLFFFVAYFLLLFPDELLLSCLLITFSVEGIFVAIL